MNVNIISNHAQSKLYSCKITYSAVGENIGEFGKLLDCHSPVYFTYTKSPYSLLWTLAYTKSTFLPIYIYISSSMVVLNNRGW